MSVTIAWTRPCYTAPVGGAAVMARQLRYLADLAAQPNVSLRIVPYGAGHHPSLVTGAFMLLEFRHALRDTDTDTDTDTDIVYAANLTGELYLDKPHELQHYRDAHTTILGCALEETATHALLKTAAKELEQ